MGDVMSSLIGAGVGMAGGIISGGMNASMVMSQNRYNERLMREAWAREDTAVQRRAADMAAAGFNPVLATGAAAQSMGPVHMESPQMGNIAASALEGARTFTDISMTQAQEDLVRANARKANAEADLMTEPITLADGTVVSWKVAEAAKLFGDALGALTEGQRRKYEYENLEQNRVSVEKRRLLFLEKHSEELLEIDRKLKQQGLSGARLENEKRKVIIEMLKLEKKWYPWKTGAEIGGTIIGGAAKTGITGRVLNIW